MRFIIEHLEKHFDKKEVLKDIDFTFEEGKIYGLLGRNGAGKTTLFNCINRDIKADGGTFFLEEDGTRREVEPEDRDKLMKDYSHGMKNKMQMLVNIIAEPKILLLDEPLTSLDVVVAEEMKQLLRSLKDGRITIFSTHIMDLALDLCDVIVLLSHGELEVVEKSNLDSREFKEKIIAALREEDHV